MHVCCKSDAAAISSNFSGTVETHLIAGATDVSIDDHWMA